jgi:hypothetical protein
LTEIWLLGFGGQACLYSVIVTCQLTFQALDASDNLELETTVDDGGPIPVLEHEDDAPDHDSEELGFENREDDFFDSAGGSDEEQGIEDDEEFLAMDSMYGFSYE